MAGLMSDRPLDGPCAATLCARTLVVLAFTGSARTLPGVTAQSPPGPQPRTIQVTWIATFVAAAFSVLAPATYFTARSWIEQQQQHSTTTRKITSQAFRPNGQAKDLANVPDNVSKALPIQLIFGLVVAAILVVIAFKLREGRHWTRWALIGVWVLVTLTGYCPVGLGGLVTLGSSAPTQVKITSFLGAAAFVVALVAVNLPASWSSPERQQAVALREPRWGRRSRRLVRPRPMTPPEPTKPARARTTSRPSQHPLGRLNQPSRRSRRSARRPSPGPRRRSPQGSRHRPPRRRPRAAEPAVAAATCGR